jgi:hypothetical protein
MSLETLKEFVFSAKGMDPNFSWEVEDGEGTSRIPPTICPVLILSFLLLPFSEAQEDVLGATQECKETVNRGDTSTELSTYVREARDLPEKESMVELPVSDDTKRD